MKEFTTTKLVALIQAMAIKRDKKRLAVIGFDDIHLSPQIDIDKKREQVVSKKIFHIKRFLIFI